jgi:hypothetical protein
MKSAKKKVKPVKTKAKAKPAAAKAKAKPAAKATPKVKAKVKAKATPTVKAKGRPATAKAKATSTAKAKATSTTKAKASPATRSTVIEANILIHEPIQPMDRGERYEDPVFEALESAGLGGAGDGGGSMMTTEGEITEVDFDVEMKSLDAIPVIIKVLEGRGAPKGSLLRYEHQGKDIEVSFGIAEGLAIYLDGVNQPREVYESTSAQELLDKLLEAFDGAAEFRGSWQGPRETSLYFYGINAQHLFERIEPVLRDYPLSRNARVIIRHGSQTLEPHEVQLAALPS